jgi:molybdenum cofactor cytidylyltransferase
VGARHIIGEAPELVCEVEMAGIGVLDDIDTPQALAKVLDEAGESGA